MLLYYTELNIRNESGEEPIDIRDMRVIAADKELTVTLSQNLKSNDSIDDLNFIVYGARGYWWANNFTWNGETLLPNRQISAVDKFSFHCSPAIHLVTSNKTVEIIWKGLQLQPKFNSKDGKLFESFGDAWDCVGFVSPAILSGLLFAFMFLFVVLIGVNCLMSIKTNDRFDNPKKVVTFGMNE